MANPYKKAILLTGAGARISQEVALLDQLIAQRGLEVNQSDTMLTGFSSGSLNILAMNGCFRDNNPLSWDDYYKGQVLANLKTSSVFTPKLPPFDTTPLRDQLNAVLGKFGYSQMGDMDFNSFVLTYSRHEFETVWANTEQDASRHLVASDVFMSSTAIPVIFPAQTISTASGQTSNWPSGKFNDGGTLGQFKRFDQHLGQYVLDNGAFDEMYIISPMREKTGTEVNKKLIEETPILQQKSMAHLDIDVSTLAMKAFAKFLVKLQHWNKQNGSMAKDIYVSIPNLEKNFPMLAFEDQIPKYEAVVKWAKNNPQDLAIPLDDFIADMDSSS